MVDNRATNKWLSDAWGQKRETCMVVCTWSCPMAAAQAVEVLQGLDVSPDFGPAKLKAS